MGSQNKKGLRGFLIICFWLVIWELASHWIDNSIILVGPIETASSLFRLLGSSDFRISVITTLSRIFSGFLISFLIGLFTGSLAYRFPFFREITDPVVHLLKSIPVASFIILALIWAGSDHLGTLVSALVVFPTIHIQTMTGLSTVDCKLLELGKVFRIPLYRQIRFFYLPATYPHLYSGLKIALSMCWKSGIAAEIIGVPTHSIGEHLYLSKVYLETGDVLAWTVVIILLSSILERIILLLLSFSVPGGIREINHTESL